MEATKTLELAHKTLDLLGDETVNFTLVEKCYVALREAVGDNTGPITELDAYCIMVIRSARLWRFVEELWRSGPVGPYETVYDSEKIHFNELSETAAGLAPTIETALNPASEATLNAVGVLWDVVDPAADYERWSASNPS